MMHDEEDNTQGESATPENSAESASAKQGILDNDDAVRQLRMLEAILFAAVEPLDEKSIAVRLPDGAPLDALLQHLQEDYAERGVNLVKLADKWALRTAPDLHHVLQEHRQDTRRLSRAALETLAIIAYHQPVTRAEIEEVRGHSLGHTYSHVNCHERISR